MKKHIVLLGNSSGLPALIEDLRAHDQESDITLVASDSQWPYYRHLLPQLIAKEISPVQALVKPVSFYTDNKVQPLFDKKVTKVNFRKGQLVLEEKELVLDFDVLVISSLPDRKLPDIKGVNKTGIYAMDQAGAVNLFIKELPFIETAVIQSSSVFAAETAAAIQKREKEALIIADSAQKKFSMLPEGIRLIEDNPIQEVLGESDARAVRLKSGKVVACDAILFGELDPHFRLFQDTPVNLQERILVDAGFRTSQENIFAMDEALQGAACTYLEEGQAYIQRVSDQARVIASQILGLKASVSAQEQLAP